MLKTRYYKVMLTMVLLFLVVINFSSFAVGKLKASKRDRIISDAKAMTRICDITKQYKIPSLIHQTYPSKEKLSYKQLNYIETFKENSGYHHVFWDDTAMFEFFDTFYPNYTEKIKKLPQMIMKVDFFRYFVIYEFGGLYSDVDTESLKPIDTWMRDLYPNATAIIGLECDSTSTRKVYTNRKLQLTQWSFAFAPKHPMLWYTIQCIFKRLESRSMEDWTKKEVSAAELTGPGTWTDCIAEYMEEKNIVESYIDDLKYTLKPRLVGGEIVVLPVVSFNPDYYLENNDVPGSGRHWDKYAFIKHHYHGEWKLRFD